MSSFNPQVITKKGEELIARALAEDGAIHWTRVALGDGSPGGNAAELEELISPKLDAILINNNNLGETAELIAKFSNENIVEEFDIKELGIFGKIEGDTESILYSYSTASDCSRIPINSNPFEMEWSIYTQIINGDKIDILINPTLQMLNKETADGLYEPKFIKKSGFNLDITNLINSTSEILVASALAVKTAYDKAVSALNRANSAYDLASSCQIRVKQFYITEDSENPAFTWPGTTWAKLEGRLLLGTSSGYALGTEGGASTVTLTKANLPNIKLNTDPHLHTQPAHTHGLGGFANGGWGEGNSQAQPGDNGTYKTGSAGGENTGVAAPQTEALGSGAAFNIMNPHRAVNIWRRTA